MRTDLKKTGLSLKTIYDKLKKFFYVGLLLIPTLLFLGSPELHGNPGGAICFGAASVGAASGGQRLHKGETFDRPDFQ